MAKQLLNARVPYTAAYRGSESIWKRPQGQSLDPVGYAPTYYTAVYFHVSFLYFSSFIVFLFSFPVMIL